MAYQINARYNTHTCDGTCRHVNYDLRFVKSTSINNSLKEATYLTLVYLTDSFLIGYMEVRHSLLYYVLLVLPYLMLVCIPFCTVHFCKHLIIA